MKEQAQGGKCGRGADAAGAANTETASNDGATKLLKARVPQDCEAHFNVRVVPGRSLGDIGVLTLGCRPRGHSTGWARGLAALAPELVATLAKADKAMVAWLARDEANTLRFLSDPVAAMRDAGVELSRSDEKALARASAAAAATRVVPPGVRIASLSAKTFPKGRVGHTNVTRPDAKPSTSTDDFGCGPKRKG